MSEKVDMGKICLNPIWDGDVASSLSDDGNLWDFNQLKIVQTWMDYGVQGKGVNCYVIDSGIVEHNLFAHSKVKPQSFMGELASGVDGNGHGTWCCGKVGARGVGIAPECNLHSLRVLDDSGSGYTYYTTDALRWVAEQEKPHVVNLSLGSYYYSATQQAIINQLVEKGCIVVAAAGNEDTDDLSYPAAYEGVLAVAATDSNKERAWFSNYGEHICVSAPGVSCYSTYLDGKFRKLMGTSMAAPTVSGMLVLGYELILKNHPKMDMRIARDHLIKALKDSADDLGAVGKDDYHGYGGINGPKFMKLVSEI